MGSVKVAARRLCQRALEPPIRFASDPPQAPVSFEIFTHGSGPHSLLPSPAKEPTTEPENQSNTEYALDGLENDRNSVVQIASCLAVVPMGLWEHTFGALGKHSRDQAEKLAATLNSVAVQGHFEDRLAEAVVASLRPRVLEAVRRNEEPLTLSLAKQTGAGSAGPPPPTPATPAPNALEIEVLNTALSGKRANSSSRALTVLMRVTVIRTSDGQELYSCPVRYRSANKKLKDWAASDGQPLREELNECTRQTADALAQELIKRGFVTTKPSPTSL